MSTIIIITPPKKDKQPPGVQKFNVEAVEGARTSDVLRELANAMDELENVEPSAD